MKFLDYLLGRYLASSEELEQRIGPATGVSMLGLDALSSSAYGPEAALTVMIPLGTLGLHFILPITAAIIILLFVVYFSYRQTIMAYPTGGGSYTVAKENLGRGPGVLAAAALLLDYILTVAVGISAGVGALISAVPFFQPYVLPLCLLILLFITIANLRGIKESGVIFTIPTYAFIVSMLGTIVYGLIRVAMAGGHPIPVESTPALVTKVGEAAGFWFLLKAFASGCTAMTGVEAVSNGVKVFREPLVRNAERTLTYIIVILAAMLAGIAYLCFVYGIGATNPGEAGYESMISQLLRAVVGRGGVYYVTICSVIFVLCFSANTAYSDFPRLCQILARDNYLPHAFAERGRRLVFSQGILVLSVLAGALLIIFDGITDNLIPLYAIGAFLAFTLSQAGMVAHWMKIGWREHWYSVALNFTGAIATGTTLVIVLFSKFTEGGWVTVVMIPLAMITFFAVRRHYSSVDRQLGCHEPMDFNRPQSLVVVPVRGWNRVTRKALQYASQISDQVYAVNVANDDGEKFDLEKQWEKYVNVPAERAGVVAPKLIRLENPYRRLFGSLFKFIDELERQFPDSKITMVIPNLAEHRWYHFLLHNQRAVLLSAALYMRGDPRIVTVTVPWYLDA